MFFKKLVLIYYIQRLGGFNRCNYPGPINKTKAFSTENAFLFIVFYTVELSNSNRFSEGLAAMRSSTAIV